MPRAANPKVNGYKNAGRLAALETRQKNAAELLERRAARDDLSQIEILAARPGFSAKEWDRLWKRIEP